MPTTSPRDGRTAPDAVARTLVVRGRVQGVFFRAATQEVARRVGVVGWVTNRRDGSVEIWLEGEPGAVDQVEAWVRDGGPDAARVDEVEVTEQHPDDHSGFEIR